MLEVDIYGKELSSTFNSKLISPAQSIKPKILIDMLDSRHSSNLSVTTNSAHSSTSIGDLGYYFTPKQSSNGFERQSVTWGVAGALDINGNVIRADGTWYAMPSDLSDNYEYGWWSNSKSTSSLHGTYNGYSFASNPTLTVEFDSRKCNLIRITTSEFYGQIDTYTIVVRSLDAGVPNPLFTETSRIVDGSYYFDHYLPESLGHDSIYRIEITVLTTKHPEDYARIQEVNPIYQVDISDYVTSYTLNKVRDLHESSLPIAGTSASAVSVDIDNTSKKFNIFNNNSDFGPYMKKDLKVRVTSGWKIQKYDDLYVDKVLTANLSNSSNTLVISDTYDLPDGGAGDQFVMVIDPDGINREIILCDTKDSTYQITVSQRGYAGSVARNHLNGTTVRFETYEYPEYSEYYIDDWNASSDGMRVGFNASDWSRFFTERLVTKGFFLEKATVPDACESLVLSSNFPKSNFKSLNRYDISAKKNGAILHFDFNESTIDRSGNVITVADGLRSRFFAMPEGLLNKVKDMRADALDRELSDLEKALGETSFISPSYVANSVDISTSSLALNIGELSGYQFTSQDGSIYSEYFNCVFDGFYTPTDTGSQYVIIDIANGGVRVYLDDTLILNEWRLHPVSTGSYITLESEELNLTQGKPYKIRIEAFHTSGDFAIKLKSAVGILASVDVLPKQVKTIAAIDRIGTKDPSFEPASSDRNKRTNYALYLGGGDIGLTGGMTSMPENKSCHLGSSKYIRLPYDTSWDMTSSNSPTYTGNFSIEMYIKPTGAYSGSGEYISMWVDSGTTSNGFEFFFNSTSHGFKIKTSTGVLQLSTNGSLSTSDWSHIVVTYNSVTDLLSYYVNGSLVDSDTINGYITLWNNIDLTFGGRYSYYNTSTDTEVAPSSIRDIYLDEFLIYNKCLTENDVADRYTETQMQEVNIYPFLYGAEGQIRTIIDEITLADLGRLYINEKNQARYDHYYRFFESTIDQHSNVQTTISDSNHIINADYIVQLQTNKVVVKIAGISSNLVGTQSLWRAPSPTTLAAVELSANILANSTSMYVSTTTDPPFLKSGYIIIDDEIIKYSDKTPNQFLNLERGLFGTTAASHNTSSNVREVRYWDLKYEKAPAFQVKNPFITGILFEEPDEIDILKWIPSAYGAEFIIAASNNVTPGTFVFAEGTNPLTDEVAYTAIAGIPVVVTEQSSQVKEQVANLEDNIRLYGLKEITIENKFITDYNYGQRIANFIIDKMG
jgi:hypothetical protein